MFSTTVTSSPLGVRAAVKLSGVAPEPNVSFCVYRQPRTGEIAVAVVSLTAICCGAELLAAYGEKYEV